MLSVVLYHFGVPGFEGGFVGVDIFFVISGFLIGGILWREYDGTGRVNLGRFFLRRFRRLAPAFFVMVAVTAALAWVILLPFEFREFGKAMIASSVYLSNVLFYRDAGYFDAASDEKVLLHTWSLSVEEQFYIFLPLFILLLARFRGLLAASLVLLFVTSFCASVLLTPLYPKAAFFLFPFRMWELLAGVLLAIYGHRFKRPWTGFWPVQWIGLGLVIWSVTSIEAGDHFPGMVAMVPVLGTVLMLANGRSNNPVSTVLCAPIPVFFGLISYSLYLWHWPVMTLSNYLRGDYLGWHEAVLWLAISVGLAYLSWRFVERPVRTAFRLPGWALAGTTALVSAATVATGGWIYVNDGLTARFGPDAQPHIAASGDFLQDWTRCYVPDRGPLMGIEVCPIGPDGPPELLVWGDSHVRAFKEGIDLAAHEAGRPGLIIWRAGCPPLFDLRKNESAATPSQDTACTHANVQIKQALRSMPSVRDILLIGRWTYYASGRGVGLDAENEILVTPTTAPPSAGIPQSDVIAKAIADTVAVLNRHFDHVAVLRQPPEIARYDSRIAAREVAHRHLPLAGSPRTEVFISREALRERAAIGEAPFRALAQVGQITWIDTWPAICDETNCHVLVSGKGYYFDNNHVTNTAALQMRALFHELLPPDARARTLVQEARLQ